MIRLKRSKSVATQSVKPRTEKQPTLKRTKTTHTKALPENEGATLLSIGYVTLCEENLGKI